MSTTGLISPADQSAESCPSIAFVLERLAKQGASTPRDIAQNRLRESVVRLHCDRLEHIGYAHEQAFELYEISEKGRSKLSEDADIPSEYRNYIDSRQESHPRISDLSEFTSYDIKGVNLRIFENNQDYGLIFNDVSKTRRRILNVHGSKIYRVLREFPLDQPLVSQCAHWIRSFAGIHFFPDANHRTGMWLLHGLLENTGVSTENLPGEYIDRAVLRSKLIRLLHLDSITIRDLWKKDIYYQHWNRYFRSLLYDSRDNYDSDCSLARLRASLRSARENR